MSDDSEYDPNYPVPYWHQTLELIFLCTINALSLLIIVTRTWLRYIQLKTFRADDYWIIVAGVTLVIYWAFQIATNYYGSGLHIQNLTYHEHILYWQLSTGWLGYYLICSMIKVSVSYCILGILPTTYTRIRLLIYIIAISIMCLGIAESLIWIFQCQPFLSNFLYEVLPVTCADIDVARYVWVGASVVFDGILVVVPIMILKQVRLDPHKRTVLQIVFGANIMGTITCLVGIYGIWEDRNAVAGNDSTYFGTPFIIINDFEILMYAIGASATVGSKYLVAKSPAIASFLSSGKNKISRGLRGENQANSGTEGSNLPSQTPRRPSGSYELIEVTIDRPGLQNGVSGVSGVPKPTTHVRTYSVVDAASFAKGRL